MEGYPASLALFSKKPLQTGIDKTEWVEHRPSAPITKGAPVEFTIPDTGVEYLDLQKTRLYMRVKIKKADGSPVTEVDKVGLANAPLHTLWRQVDLALSEQVVTSDVATNYGYKALMDIILR